MTLPWQLRSYHTLMTSTLDGIGESHGCTSEIQLIVIPVRLDTNFHVARVQTIIRRCMVSIGGTLGCTPSQHDIQQTFPPVPDRGARGVKRVARRLPSRGVGGGRLLVPPFPSRHRHADPGYEVERGEGSRT
ncbi:hypothetical protein M9H77_34632 [Catharanthus roseus]|uniref:Uncharacterized protein n=1 Tax=Catharanthus roseus TaxID=4058 RepID=A0ACB9ZNW0_CATRO|nr:hypothetical protein M9H77_34632 [Catharanthus roseus]